MTERLRYCLKDWGNDWKIEVINEWQFEEITKDWGYDKKIK